MAGEDSLLADRISASTLNEALEKGATKSGYVLGGVGIAYSTGASNTTSWCTYIWNNG